jgi:hypothetical protein
MHFSLSDRAAIGYGHGYDRRTSTLGWPLIHTMYAWVGDGTDPGLPDALTTWFGGPDAA